MIPKAPLVALLALAPVTVALAATPRVEVPIQQSVLAGGAPRYWVMLSIADGEPSRAMLDTGSTGLRVLAAAVPPTGVTRTDASKTYGYTSGAEYDGVIARARISLGAAQTKDDFPFQLIDKAGCSKAKPNCPVLKVAAKDYRIGGRGAQGFMIILGANMAASDAPNPLAAMADSWIIELPRPGSSQPGRLILNPNDADRAASPRCSSTPSSPISRPVSTTRCQAACAPSIAPNRYAALCCSTAAPLRSRSPSALRPNRRTSRPARRPPW